MRVVGGLRKHYWRPQGRYGKRSDDFLGDKVDKFMAQGECVSIYIYIYIYTRVHAASLLAELLQCREGVSLCTGARWWVCTVIESW